MGMMDGIFITIDQILNERTMVEGFDRNLGVSPPGFCIL